MPDWSPPLRRAAQAPAEVPPPATCLLPARIGKRRSTSTADPQGVVPSEAPEDAGCAIQARPNPWNEPARSPAASPRPPVPPRPRAFRRAAAIREPPAARKAWLAAQATALPTLRLPPIPATLVPAQIVDGWATHRFHLRATSELARARLRKSNDEPRHFAPLGHDRKAIRFGQVMVANRRLGMNFRLIARRPSRKRHGKRARLCVIDKHHAAAAFF